MTGLFDLDVQCLYFIHKTCAHPALTFLMTWLTEMGNGEFLAIVAMILIARGKKEYVVAGILILAGLTLSYQIVVLVKQLVARPRPFAMFPDITNVLKEKGFSFPSYHTLSAFMTATILSGIFRKYVLFFTLAAGVGISRVYFGVHFPSDVIVGAAFGILLGFILILVARRAQFLSRPRSSIG
jgi:undecaprenyl-diphosphatase